MSLHSPEKYLTRKTPSFPTIEKVKMLREWIRDYVMGITARISP
jgi:hypothetical protein